MEAPAEPISPELVLVDPALARFARAALPDAPSPEPLRAAPSTAAGWRARPWVDLVRLVLAAVLGGAVVLLVLGTQRSGRHLEALPQFVTSPLAVPTQARAPAAPRPVRRHRHPRRRAARPVLTRPRLRAERYVLISLPTARRRVPATLVDPRTGIARTNVQATCTQKGSPTFFVCLVRRRGLPPNAGLVVGCRLRADGTAQLFWYGYRRA